MQTLYLIRHTTPSVAPGSCYGQLDVGVSDSFAVEAANILNWLPQVDLIVTSPLLRARCLAEYLSLAQCCELRCDARLMEKSFGAWEGKAWDDISRSEIDAWAADLMEYAPPGGESAQQMMLRVRAFLDEVARLPQRRIALVAHAGSIRAMLAQLAGVKLATTLNWQIEYGALICVPARLGHL